MEHGENSTLFSLAHLRRLAAAPGGGGAGSLTLARAGAPPFVPLSVMPPLVLPPRRAKSPAWLMPAILTLCGLVAISVSLLVFVLVSGPKARPVAVPARAPAIVLQASRPGLGPAPSPVETTSPAASALPEAAESRAADQAADQGPAPSAAPAAPKEKERKLAKVDRRGRGRGKLGKARWGRSKPQVRLALRHRKPKRAAPSRRTELDRLLDSALR